MSPSPGSLGALMLALGTLRGVAAEQERAASSLETPDGGASEQRRLALSRQETPQGPRWSVQCVEAPLDELVRALSREAGLALEGSELLPLGARVTIQLERRPLEQVLDFVLGTQGLRHELARGILRVHPPASEPAELLRLAQAAWQAVEDGGGESAAARARLAQGNLAELEGDLEGAYRLYAELAEAEGDGMAEATYRAGRVLQRLGHWAESAQHFRTLASLDGAERFHSLARLELARVSVELGDAASALHLLNFLDANFATHDAAERAERRLVRAQAFNATGEHVEALRTLEEGGMDAAARSATRTLAVRAAALEGLGFEIEAARAWLIFAREAAAPAERTGAFEKAAELSLAGGDELGALFVCREAARASADQGLGGYAHAARLRLGLEDEAAPATVEERLDLAEALLAGDEPSRAAELFEGLYLARNALPEPDQARVLAGWSRVVRERAGLTSAIELLSKARATLADPLAARTLDLAAAALFESEERFEEAAEAYRGIY